MASFEALTEGFDLTPGQQGEMRRAYDQAARGFELVVARAGSWPNPTAGLLTLCRRGAHLEAQGEASSSGSSEPIAYEKLLGMCEGLVLNTGHEYLEATLKEELIGLERRVGKGARLTEHDRTKLLHTASDMRAHWDAGAAERNAKLASAGKRWKERVKAERDALR